MSQKNFADAMNQIVNSTPNGLRAQINAKADKNSPALTGTPTAPTPADDDDSTRIATTAFVNKKAPIDSPDFTGTPTAPTADNDTDSTQLATTEFCQNLIRRLVGSAPETLNTLVELATAINNDPDFAETIIQALDNKLNKTDAATTYLTKTDASSTYLTQTSANSTYMKKTDSIDTSNFAKLDTANTFTKAQTINGKLTVGNLTIEDIGGGGVDIKHVNGSYIRFTTGGYVLVCASKYGTRQYALTEDGTWG